MKKGGGEGGRRKRLPAITWGRISVVAIGAIIFVTLTAPPEACPCVNGECRAVMKESVPVKCGVCAKGECVNGRRPQFAPGRRLRPAQHPHPFVRFAGCT